MEKGTHSGTDLRTEPCILACSRACMVSGKEYVMEKDMEHRRQCLQGLSTLQINILSIIKAHQEVLPYWQIAHMVGRHFGGNPTEGAVRGALERMFSRDFLLRSRASRGRLKGNRYALAKDPCPHIPSCNFVMESAADSAAHSGRTPEASFLSEEIDRKNLSISSQSTEPEHRLEELTEEDISFHWPTLARDGFGTAQIRQICQRLHKIGIPTTRILQGLIHAEWEMVHGIRKDSKGNPIEKPAHWVFGTLARQGYYPRPAGYISPQEQAERDAEEERKRFAAAHEARKDAEYEAWAVQLTPQEREHIVRERSPTSQGALRMPELVALRAYFFAKVWPEVQRREQP